MSISIDNLIIEGIKLLSQYYKKRKKKNLPKISAGSTLLFNISGHKLSDNAKNMLNDRYENLQIVDILPNVNMDVLEKGIVEEAFSIVEQMMEYSDIFTGKYRVILPGYSPLAAVLLALLHGVSGFFVSIILLKRVDNEFLPDGALNLQDFRDTIRSKSREIEF